jgi:hypothetical protein
MENNSLVSPIDQFLKGDKEALKTECEKIQLDSCPCVGKSVNHTRLVSNHPGYPDYKGAACVSEVKGEQTTSTPEHGECVLAAVCQHFMPEEYTSKFDGLCQNNRECNVPKYTGYGSDSKKNTLSDVWGSI